MAAAAAVGAVPLEWYKDEDHVGYDAAGAKIARAQRGDALDALLARADGGAAARTIYDAYNDEEVVLSKEELGMLLRIRRGQFPHVEVRRYVVQHSHSPSHPLIFLPNCNTQL